MPFETKNENNCGIIYPVGRISLNNAESFKEQMQELLQQGVTSLIIDCTNLEYLSSIGLRVILEIAKAINKANKKLAIVAPKGIVRDIFEDAGFSLIFPVVEDIQTAQQAMV